jgi:hypothetical protein
MEVQATTINGDPADGTALIPTSPTTSSPPLAIAVAQSSLSALATCVASTSKSLALMNKSPTGG